MIDIRTPQTDDPCAEMGEFQLISCEAISAFLTLTTRGDATGGEMSAVNDLGWSLIDFVRERDLRHPQDRVYALLFAAFAQIGPIREMLPGGRFSGDPADVFRRFADWIDSNLAVNA